MAIIRKTMEEIEKTMTPERIEQETENARRIGFVYDEECPPRTEDELKRFHRVAPKQTAV